MRRHSFVALWTVILPSLMICSRAGAWEADVHEGLTKWLALQGGFSEHEADTIARGDGCLDESDYTSAPWTVAVMIILKGDLETSRKMQQWHFPGDGPLPSAPEKRAVVHDSLAARYPLLQIIDQPFSPNRDKNLHELGERLHAFQDSWSHEGVPDTPFHPFPFEVRRDLVWAHPAKRGGWQTHDADLTYLHPDQTVEMALQTYAILRTFLAKNPGPPVAPAAPTSVIEAQVRTFAAIASAQQKEAWLLGHGLAPDRAGTIAREISLPQVLADMQASDRASSQTIAERTFLAFTSVAEAADISSYTAKIRPPPEVTTGGAGPPPWQEPDMSRRSRMAVAST